MADWLKRVFEKAEQMYESLPEWKKRAIEADAARAGQKEKTL